MPTQPDMRPHRDSWPPTVVRLGSSSSSKRSSPGTRPDDDGPRPLLEDIDDNPLTYFLTPPPPGPDDMDVDMADEDMDFDAGIEDAARPREPVRSVSPSSLSGLSKPRRTASPDFDSDGLTTDEDDDEEDYIHFFSPAGPSRLAALRNIGIDGLRLRSQSPPVLFPAGSSPRSHARPPLSSSSRPGRGLLSPAWSYPGPSPVSSLSSSPPSSPPGRGRSHVAHPRFGHAQPRSSSARARAGRLWREPSPDVWSIEEETEEEMVRSEGGGVMLDVDGRAVEKTAAKPKKRVRFVLPDGE
ncbi:fungal specific transcription factor domain-containing protein [Purpureocillium lavendulum]|uniref:Fungal specific transcription factor domain-containing protein n=1 Tax=Purpureocillium lavendulum TaxID=1247861 RepID=A0AB34FV65_9HYPO|nr:fungal specific transcription factor domain-containing protein [Purpureocillium lavendulum]